MPRRKFNYSKSINKRVQSVNAMVQNAERRYGKDSQIVKRMYNTIEKATGKEDAVRFSYIKDNTTLHDINKYDRGLALIENSAYATEEGRKRVREKAFNSFLSNNQRYVDKGERIYDYFEKSSEWDKLRALSEPEVEKMYDKFENSIDWQNLHDKAGVYSSAQELDAISRLMDVGLTNKTIDRLTRNWLRVQGMENHPDSQLDFSDYVNKYATRGKRATIENRIRKEERRLNSLYGKK